MKTYYLLAFCIATIVSCDCCEEDRLNPDLVPDLLDIAAGTISMKEAKEGIDWEYVIESVNDSVDCKSLDAIASIAGIVVDYFENENDVDGDVTFNETQSTKRLEEGEKGSNEFKVTFPTVGIYMPSLTADIDSVVLERNENNNVGVSGYSYRSDYDMFQNASLAFKEKLTTASAIVVVGNLGYDETIKFYQGKKIYYINN